MAKIEIRTQIEAPLELCFDMTRDVRIHEKSASFSRERLVPPGRTEGLLERGDLVAFEGRHFGLRQKFVTRITELERPHRFVDEMESGIFRWLRHVHEFVEVDGGTDMIDTLTWEAPLGPIGRLADRVFLRRHMSSFVTTKQQALKLLIEARRDELDRMPRSG